MSEQPNDEQIEDLAVAAEDADQVVGGISVGGEEAAVQKSLRDGPTI